MSFKIIQDYHSLLTRNATIEIDGVRLNFREDNFCRKVGFSVDGEGGYVSVVWDQNPRLYLDFYKLKTFRGRLWFLLDAKRDDIKYSPVLVSLLENLEKAGPE